MCWEEVNFLNKLDKFDYQIRIRFPADASLFYFIFIPPGAAATFR